MSAYVVYVHESGGGASYIGVSAIRYTPLAFAFQYPSAEAAGEFNSYDDAHEFWRWLNGAAS